MSIPLAVAMADLLLVVILIARGLDVRLILILASLPLFAATGQVSAMLVKLVGEMANPGTVVPICSALGFAYVLRLTGCDQHLVRLLLRPLRQARILLVPGGIAAAYVFNTTIVSQAGTAAVLGPILIPLLRGGGISYATAGSILLLGSSMGGELFNPGAVEMRKLAELTGLSGQKVVAQSSLLNLSACTAALLAFWSITLLRKQDSLPDSDRAPAIAEGGSASFPIHPLKALVPVVPLALLFADSALGQLSPLNPLQGPPKILAAMLIGVATAGIVVPGSVRRLAESFFEGAGYGYTHVISLIVAASTFAEGIRLSGLIERIIPWLSGWPAAAIVMSTFVPWALAAISGTGIAPAVSVMEFFVPAAGEMGLEPVRLGTLAAMGAHFGRTMSPAAAVVMVCSRLTHTPPSTLIRGVTPPLFIGGVVLVLIALITQP
jgi:DcuC family C4-dicarboxylate transporter